MEEHFATKSIVGVERERKEGKKDQERVISKTIFKHMYPHFLVSSLEYIEIIFFFLFDLFK